jgi:ABC-type nitrate/sulfonate/bicarbonate transport system permease component
MNTTNNKTFDENAFALSIKHALNESAQALPQARRLATAQRKTTSTQSAFQHAMQSLQRMAQSLVSPLAFAAPVLVVGVGLYIMSNTNADNYLQTVAEIDSQVLTQDLPIDALLDKGFVRYVQVGE